MRLICWAKHSVDLHGIDDHCVAAVRVGSFAAVIKTHLGERIGIWHQMASMPHGKTLLSPVQMEAHRCSINEKSPHITGRTPTVIDPNGYITPLSIEQGLAYMALRPPTDREWMDLPKITFTTDIEWNNRLLDAPIPSDWYDNSDQSSRCLRDKIFHRR